MRRLLFALAWLVCASVASAQVPVAIAPVPHQQFSDITGAPLAGGLVFTYAAGTSTPLATYVDSGGLVQNTNPIVLDSGGFATIWLAAASYKMCVQNAQAVQQWCVDNINQFGILGGNTWLTTQTFNSGIVVVGGGSLAGTFTGAPLFTGNVTFQGTTTFTGPIFCENIETIRCAAQFPGADWCAKVTAADADLGGTPGEIWVDQTAGTAPCVSAPTLTTGAPRVLRFIQQGTYPISVGWTLVWAQSSASNTSFISGPGTILQFTGNNGMLLDGTPTANGARNIYWENLAVFGNSSITNALTIRNVNSSTFVNLKTGNSTGASLLCQFCVLDTFVRPKVSTNDQDLTVFQTEGIRFDWISAVGNTSNSNTLITPVVEGLVTAPGIGIHIAHAGETKIVGGSSEGNLIGVQIDNFPSGGVFGLNDISDFDTEANASIGISDNAFGTVLQNVSSQSPVIIGALAVGTRILNGFYNGITITAGAKNVSLEGLTYNFTGAGVITDAGTATSKRSVYNAQTFTNDPDQIVGQLISTLPIGTAPFSIVSTTPVANLTLLNHPQVQSCGSTITCSHTPLTGAQIVVGTVALSSGTPSTATITGISPAYFSTTSYVCNVTETTTAANNLFKVTNVSSSSFTITGPNTVTDVVNYICIGN